MSQPDYTTIFTVPQSPAEVYAAIVDVRAWWGLDVDGPTDQLGEEFVFRGEDKHFSRIRVVTQVPGQRVEWLVLDNALSYVEDQSEWQGNRIVFDITEPEPGTTQLRFTQHGLVPAYECFDICSNAWTFFITDSLRSLITTGTGQPMPAWSGAGV